MDIVPLLIQLASGAVGGNVVAALIKKLNLGTLGNSIAGILGGGIGGQIMAALGLSASGAGTGALDPAAILSSIGGGAAGGGVLLAIVGILKNLLGKK